jgi:hypothetical protein
MPWCRNRAEVHHGDGSFLCRNESFGRDAACTSRRGGRGDLLVMLPSLRGGRVKVSAAHSLRSFDEWPATVVACGGVAFFLCES